MGDTFDASKLTPEPWVWQDSFACGQRLVDGRGEDVIWAGGPAYAVEVFGRETDLEFVPLARAAFGVMMRRGWGPQRTVEGDWLVWFGHQVPGRLQHFRYPDPFTALVAADEWYRANCEGR